MADTIGLFVKMSKNKKKNGCIKILSWIQYTCDIVEYNTVKSLFMDVS
jgi:hypothetical protein